MGFFKKIGDGIISFAGFTPMDKLNPDELTSVQLQDLVAKGFGEDQVELIRLLQKYGLTSICVSEAKNRGFTGSSADLLNQYNVTIVDDHNEIRHRQFSSGYNGYVTESMALEGNYCIKTLTNNGCKIVSEEEFNAVMRQREVEITDRGIDNMEKQPNRIHEIAEKRDIRNHK